jgi:glucose/mannose transport system permease protein
VLGFAFIYGLMVWNGLLSLSASRMLPNYEWVGLMQYDKLWEMDRWWVALQNLAIFGGGYVRLAGHRRAAGRAAGPEDPRRRRLRTIYLYPMALSFIVTGTAWKWLLNPGLGIEKWCATGAFEHFSFDWLVSTDGDLLRGDCRHLAERGLCHGAVLAGLRGIDDSIIKAAQVDGASLPRIYWRIVLPACGRCSSPR